MHTVPNSVIEVMMHYFLLHVYFIEVLHNINGQVIKHLAHIIAMKSCAEFSI